MNLDILQGKWHVLRGRIRSRWGRLTNDDLDRLEGGLEQLAGLVQQRYGLLREQAQNEAEAFFKTCEDLVEADRASEARSAPQGSSAPQASSASEAGGDQR